jgi:hypothetical protein
MRWVLRKPDGWQGFHPATGEPQADAFEEGAHPCSMGLWVLVTELHLPRNALM